MNYWPPSDRTAAEKTSMRMFICTLPRMRPLYWRLCTTFALTLLCVPAGAQKNPRNHPNKAQAELRIQIKIAPVVFPPHHKHKDNDGDKDRDEAGVTYNMQTSAEKFSVIEETRSMLVDGLKHEQVQLTTVVMK